MRSHSHVSDTAHPSDAQRVVTRILIIAPVFLLAPLWVPLAGAVGYQSLWASPDISFTQAARAGDSATVFRMLSVERQPVSLPALEAAVESRQVETVRVLIEHAGPLSESDRERLACVAEKAFAPEVASFLRSSVPSATQPDCSAYR